MTLMKNAVLCNVTPCSFVYLPTFHRKVICPTCYWWRQEVPL